jgi:hypothetical protein
MTITDEMVEKALIAEAEVAPYDGPDTVSMRAALEAVAPMLIADYQQSLNVLGDAYDEQADKFAAERPKLIFQGLMQAVQIASEGRDSGHTIDYIIALFLKRAQELDAK